MSNIERPFNLTDTWLKSESQMLDELAAQVPFCADYAIERKALLLDNPEAYFEMRAVEQLRVNSIASQILRAAGLKKEEE